MSLRGDLGFQLSVFPTLEDRGHLLSFVKQTNIHYSRLVGFSAADARHSTLHFSCIEEQAELIDSRYVTTIGPAVNKQVLAEHPILAERVRWPISNYRIL